MSSARSGWRTSKALDSPRATPWLSCRGKSLGSRVQSLMEERDMPRRRIKIMHTSDVHLESDTIGKREEGKTYRWRIQQACKKTVDRVIDVSADLFFIA